MNASNCPSAAKLRFLGHEALGRADLKSEPRFLHHGEDVFLDTLRANTVVFLTVELDGVGSMVDLEVNGLVEAEPRAARATSSLELGADEEA